MKTCNECKHMVKANYEDPSGQASRCEAPQAWDNINLVTGEKSRSLSYCETLRGPEDIRFLWRKTPPKGYCGREGHWFEPKEPA